MTVAVPGTCRTYLPRTCSRCGRRGPLYSLIIVPALSGTRANKPRPQSHGATKLNASRPNAAAVSSAAESRAASCSRALRQTRAASSAVGSSPVGSAAQIGRRA
eukprot:scaffold11460_cov64-Phaeocystis_antarctica.AAC.5